MSPGFTAILDTCPDHMIMAWRQVAAGVVMTNRAHAATRLLSTRFTAFTVILDDNSLTTRGCHTAVRGLAYSCGACHFTAIVRPGFEEVIDSWCITRHSVSWNRRKGRSWKDEWQEQKKTWTAWTWVKYVFSLASSSSSLTQMFLS